MRKREKSAHGNLIGLLPLTDMDRFDRVENIVSPGMLDINYCIRGMEGWIETKAPIVPVRSSTALFGSNHPLLQSQKNFILRQLNAGGRAFVYINASRERDHHKMLVQGRHADSLNEMTLEEIISVSCWYNQDWILFINELVK